MLTKEQRERIADFFDAAELVDFLQIKTADVVDAFEIEIEDALEDIEDMIGIRRDEEDD